MIVSPKNGTSSPNVKSDTTIYGLRPVIEALESDTHIDCVYIQNGLVGPLSSTLKSRIREKGIPFRFVPVEKLNRLAKGNHQGVVALISPIVYRQALDLIPKLMEEEKSPFLLMLDHVTDVRNFGAIARTAECAGIDGVIIPSHGSAQVTDDAVKTSSGALLRLPVCREDNLKTCLNLARQCGMQVVAATEKGATDYLTVDYRKPTLLIMGAEESGVSPELIKLADARAKLPILGQVESLNVSVAAAVFMYEALRQRGLPQES